MHPVKKRVHQIHEREFESVVKNMQYLDLFSCHYVSLCEISVFITSLVAMVFFYTNVQLNQKQQSAEASVTKMVGESHEKEQE